MRGGNVQLEGGGTMNQPEVVMAYPTCGPACQCGWAMKNVGAQTVRNAVWVCVNTRCELKEIKFQVEPSIIMRRIKE
jgi:hypothetical protein